MSFLTNEDGDSISTNRLASGVSIDGIVQNLEENINSRDASLQDAQINLLYNAALALEQCSVLNTKLEIDKWL